MKPPGPAFTWRPYPPGRRQGRTDDRHHRSAVRPDAMLAYVLLVLVFRTVRNFWRSIMSFKFTTNSSEDNKTFDEINNTPGVYGKGSDEPAYWTPTPGTTFKVAGGEIVREVDGASFAPEDRFRRLSGHFTVEGDS